MRHSKSSLFLMELIIAILFFSLASTVCIRLFVRSHRLSSLTVEQNQAVLQAQNLAEIFAACEGDPAQMKALLPDHVADTAENVYMLCFDEEWTLDNSAAAPVYTALLEASPVEEGLISARILVYGGDYSSPQEPLYSLSIVHHNAERRGAHVGQ